jgi:hypothetical protein
VSAQNADGGWPFRPGGTSWTEPTVLAILALRALHLSEPCLRGQQWLIRQQRSDGGWAPSASISESTWVTSLALLALPSVCSASPPGVVARQLNLSLAAARGTSWLLAQHSALLGGLTGALATMLDPAEAAVLSGGVSWYPGTAAWVVPTAFRAIALRHMLRADLPSATDVKMHSIGDDASADTARAPGDESSGPPAPISAGLLAEALHQAQLYLLSRRLSDSGWNHGGSYHAGEQIASYPETTGLALLALRDTPRGSLNASLTLATRYQRNPGCLEAAVWLRLAATVWQAPTGQWPPRGRIANIRDLALLILAAAAGSEKNVFTH